MTLYIQKLPRVEARQLDKDNVDELAEWCGGTIVEEYDAIDPDVMQKGINVPTKTGNERLSYRGYLVHQDTGEFQVLSASEFQSQYEPVRS